MEKHPLPPAPSRQDWVDNLRTAMIVLVVCLHATITYSHVGGWYIEEKPEPELETKLVFLLGEFHLQSFFMGLLFFVAAFFAEKSLRHRGASAFLRERLMRLGLPLVLYVAVIHPFIVYIINPWNARFPPLGEAYFEYIRSGRFLRETGPLWFVEALLLFCLGLVLWHRFVPGARTPPALQPQGIRLTAVHVLSLGAILALASFLVRIVYPIGTSVQNLQFCFFPQYAVVFVLGVVVARKGTLVEIARSPVARQAGWTAVLLGPVALAAILFLVHPHVRPKVEPPIFGGANGFALAFATWEQFTGVGLGLGTMAWMSRVWSQRTAWSHWLAARSFGVYMLHAPVIIALTVLFRGNFTNPFLNALVLSVSGTVASFLLTDLVRRIPGVANVI